MPRGEPDLGVWPSFFREASVAAAEADLLMVPVRQLDAGEHPEDVHSDDHQGETWAAHLVRPNEDQGEARNETRVEKRPQNRPVSSQRRHVDQAQSHEAKAYVRGRWGIGEAIDEVEGSSDEGRGRSREEADAAGAEGFTADGELVPLEPSAQGVMSVYGPYAKEG